MICRACREGRHNECRARAAEVGGPEAELQRSWCDCQHRPAGPAEPATGAAGE